MQPAAKTNNYHYNSSLKDRARYLRTNGTKAEAYMWKFVISKKTMGYKFLRQRPILNYIVDFVCLELMLIIECDGATHLVEGAQIKDAKRQKALEDIGFTFLRFEDEVVINHIGMVCSIVEQEINERKKSLECSNSPL